MTVVVQLTFDPGATDGLLGLWAERTVTGDVSFSAPDLPRTSEEEEEEEEVVWQVTLPADRAAASRALTEAYDGLGSTRDRLATVPDQLAWWLAGDARGVHAPDPEVAFDTVATEPGRLLAPAVEGLRRLTRASSPTAWVETTCGERLVARSRTSLSGAVSTVVGSDELRWLAQHQETLLLAAETRITALQTTAVTVRTAVAIAARLGLPGGPLLALPLAWRFIRRFVEPSTREPGP
jgi:hypothetical protein